MNRLMSDIELASFALASLVLLVAALLGYREWLDRLARSSQPTPEDVEHFARRDRRRSLGLTILCLLALGVVVGSRTPIRVAMRPNPFFLGLWLGIFGLILTLLSLAMVDWLDLRRYARRKKQAIGREQRAILNEIDSWRTRQGENAEGSEGNDQADPA